MLFQQFDTGWGRMEKIKENLAIKYSNFSKIDIVGNLIKKQVKDKYETYWLSRINETKIGSDNLNHNKLRFLRGISKKKAT